MRVVCFTNAGNEENIYTNEGLGPRRVAALLEWCRANQVELLAPQLPGRGARSKEPFLPDAQVRMRKRCMQLQLTSAADCGRERAAPAGDSPGRRAVLRHRPFGGHLDCV
jgi:surfactin synthase thioesterase subunit